jgi:hypothetical protein
MTIPFEMGESAKAHGFEVQLEFDDPRSLRTGGFAVRWLSRMRMKLCGRGFQPCLLLPGTPIWSGLPYGRARISAPIFVSV